VPWANRTRMGVIWHSPSSSLLVLGGVVNSESVLSWGEYYCYCYCYSFCYCYSYCNCYWCCCCYSLLLPLLLVPLLLLLLLLLSRPQCYTYDNCSNRDLYTHTNTHTHTHTHTHTFLVSTMNDIWKSTDKGVTWSLVTANAEWSPRGISGIDTTSTGFYLSLSLSVSLSLSPSLCTYSLSLRAHTHTHTRTHTHTHTHTGDIYIVGGLYQNNGNAADVWKSADAGSTNSTSNSSGTQ